MAKAYEAPLPPAMDLDGNYTVRLTAIDPTTGAAVSGVIVFDVAMLVKPITDSTADTGGLGDLAYGPWMLVPGPDG